ncbi:endonuclease [Corynebacterium sp. 13CS0277]|uniref:endonuclease/exonuclease/phosphatase family protein n=1 Tax=Corynebacterium sp. 13CS0277 TaxID=2071994 RepID=UPI000D03710F|nr:endonuclease/exonuclease/phosphatase family protein [Corynebacterium sp. 13CS0277]PRQ11778.1 endonuclease [Corynebacterium sp. 13CS0277]
MTAPHTPSSQHPQPAPGELRLLSLNAHAWLEEHQIPKLYRIAQAILDWDVDVVALQEVNQSQATPEVAYADLEATHFLGGNERPIREDNYAWLLVRILRQLGAEDVQWAWADAHLGFGVYDEGIAVVTRRPAGRVVRLPHAEGFDYDNVRRRVSLGVEVLPTRTGTAGEEAGLWVVSGHYSWWEDPAFSDVVQGFPIGAPKPGADKYLFRAEWEFLAPQFAELAQSAPVVLAGDYNNAASVAGEGYDLVVGGEVSGPWADSFLTASDVRGEGTVHKKIHGWAENTAALRIDYVFSSPGVRATRHAVVFGDDTPEAVSDHSGLLVDLRAEGAGAVSPR